MPKHVLIGFGGLRVSLRMGSWGRRRAKRLLAPPVQRRARRWGIIDSSPTGGGGSPACYIQTVELVEVGGSEVQLKQAEILQVAFV
jgi:hypothetical protein